MSFSLTLVTLLSFFFFFQAEDGIRDVAVTGVQTCALPISFDEIGSRKRADRGIDQVRARYRRCTLVRTRKLLLEERVDRRTLLRSRSRLVSGELRTVREQRCRRVHLDRRKRLARRWTPGERYLTSEPLS